ncbi:MAG: tRNA-dihydrouridine synthase family protein [Bdellovibrionales bacterium]|nr:tRNA-dihydrouridine synthase family protein [Bdellovibrionales bacterium]
MFLNPLKPAVILAPMEGVIDAPMRQFLTRTGHYDYCVSEFVRISSHALPSKAFKHDVPEILQGSVTSSNIPVLVQILGGDPTLMAESAENAIAAGARGIDLNFGCPAPTVNRHDGGATLLKYPERLEGIVRAVRDRVPKKFSVSAKIRLGFDDPGAVYENSRRAEQGGADWITIHGRTRLQGYMPPAYWKPIGEVKQALSIPVVANGDIFTLNDFKRCREETGCIHFMLGRSALGVPNLALAIRRELGLDLITVPSPLLFPDLDTPGEWARIFEEFCLSQPSDKRLKQWTKYLNKHHPSKGFTWWDQIKVLGSHEEIVNHLKQLKAT